jgi:hypothetical protein
MGEKIWKKRLQRNHNAAAATGKYKDTCPR